MTPHRDWFCTYEPVLEGSVFMRNDHALKIVGVGAVKIKLLDGSIRTLQGVRHVKGLRKICCLLGSLMVSRPILKVRS